MMKQFLNEIHTILTIDNSHEEDNLPFEYYDEPAANSFLGTLATAGIVFLLAILIF